MKPKEKIYRLEGKLMQYAWGGYDFLPALLGKENTLRKPFAEYWLGAHPLASADLITPEGKVSLFKLIKENPETLLTEAVFKKFGELPYLLKVQDVREILSIQVHPSKAEAEKGFERENAEGVPLNAPFRNYKDRNHKPEMLVALSEFWLLHGFKSLAKIEKELETVPEFRLFLPFYRKEGLKALYQFIMEREQAESNTILTNLIKREIRRKKEGELDKTMPGWWVANLYEHKKEIGNVDKALFSIYFFNIVRVQPGEGVFQGAGIPHAYLEGQTMELMANSDNVLRAGLTPKHVDIPELMKHTLFESIEPVIMKGQTLRTGEKVYPCPVPDFGIARIDLTANNDYVATSSSLELVIVTEGGALINNNLVLKKGEAAAILPGAAYEIHSSGNCTLFKAFVPDTEVPY